jgi:hypothetical protein
MVRLYLFAEGQTEQTFADTLLQPHLNQYNIFLHAILISKGRRRGKIQRGGGNRYSPIKKDIQNLMKQEKSAHVFFTTAIDLYGLPQDFPGFVEAQSLRQNPQQRVDFLERRFGEDIGDPRFIPHLQLHEYEAYLFSDPTGFAHLYPNTDLAALATIAAAYETPELINDGPETAPSKRMAARLPGYDRAKSTFGPQLAEHIGLPTIRERCPHFARWLGQLESLGEKGTGDRPYNK